MAGTNAGGSALIPSGQGWVTQFPNSNHVDDLKEPFRARLSGFLDALRKANASISVTSTYRPPQRAYLMHYAFLVAKGLLSPSEPPALPGVAIDWTHRGDVAAARAAAQQMVVAYDIVYAPALNSRHTEGMAIDMDVSWLGVLAVARPGGAGPVAIESLPRSDANRDLQAIGAEYGVYKLLSDPPHWSVDGH